MKLDARQIPAFLKDPGDTRLVLLHGDDEGLIRERAQILTRAVAGTLNDPFRVVELDRDGWPQITTEMTALSMIGGRRVVRIREAADTLTTPVQQAMKTPGTALLVIEAPNLGKGRLRTFVEATKDAAAIACYPEEGRALTDLIRAILQDFKVTADQETTAWLTETVGGDRSVVRGEIEKLALLAGPGGQVDIEMARACSADAAGTAGDDGLLAATAGQIEAADAAIEAAINDGLNGVALIRMALGHLQKMHQARLRMEGGLSSQEAVKTMRPPVFFRAAPAMSQALNLWPADALLKAIEEARQAELLCKTTGQNQTLLARRYVAWLARQGRARARR